MEDCMIEEPTYPWQEDEPENSDNEWPEVEAEIVAEDGVECPF